MPEGSSPHTRGALLVVPEKQWPGRIIPAYAGSTTGSAAPGILDVDHPRIRGEHGDRVRLAGQCRGSSPHTRGALLRPQHRARSRLDHPRIRGEHVRASEARKSHYGSSPHTRGAPWP